MIKGRWLGGSARNRGRGRGAFTIHEVTVPLLYNQSPCSIVVFISDNEFASYVRDELQSGNCARADVVLFCSVEGFDRDLGASFKAIVVKP